jgi:hypothetical protein
MRKFKETGSLKIEGSNTLKSLGLKKSEDVRSFLDFSLKFEMNLGSMGCTSY